MGKKKRTKAATRKTAIGKPRQPVRGFNMQFRWHDGLLKDLFSRQIELIRDHITNARSEDRMIVYLSCPISNRGGGFSMTNVAIAKSTEMALKERWGERVWILNPAAYQMESKSGRGYFRKHAEALGRVKELRGLPSPTGGDYMRMWTKILVEDDDKNLGKKFDTFYFQGPTDVAAFLKNYGGATLTAQIESYFSAKYATDADFRNFFSDGSIRWDRASHQRTGDLVGTSSRQASACEQWETRIKEFIRFYMLRASVNFSLGSHDEWNIFVELNRRRLDATCSSCPPDGDTGDLLAGFFDGKQIDPGAAVGSISRGYASSS